VAKPFSQKDIERRPRPAQLVTNTRAVPLVRKDDAHQGRVSFYLAIPRFAIPYQPKSSSQKHTLQCQ
jgi:hypothetical protein